jgi:hypothetical protein
MSWFRSHIPNRFVRFALAAGLAVVVVAAAGVFLAAAFDRGSAASATAAPASDAQRQAARARAKAEHENPSTRRIRVGQTLSMKTLKPLEPKRRMPVRNVQSSGQTPVRKLQSSGGQGAKWTLVAAPANAKATHQPGASTFTPDVHGTYVFERRPPAGAAGGNSRLQTLALQVDPVERLVCVNTRAWQAGQVKPPSIKVGHLELPRDDSTGTLQVVVLELATAGLPNDNTSYNKTFNTSSAPGYSAYADFISQTDNTNLVLVSGALSSANKDQVWSPLQKLGAADLPALDPNQDSAFSFIGIPGIAKGSAWQTVALPYNPAAVSKTSCDADMAAQQASNLSGWLTHDHTGTNYTYVSPDFVDFDTDAEDSASGGHSITVGNKTYNVPIGPNNGFHAVVLDRRTICDEAASTTDCDPGQPLLNQGFGPENGGLDAMNAKLALWADNPDALLFLAPFRAANAMKNVAPSIDLITTLRRYGASPLAPGRSLAPGVKYALVGAGQNTGYAAGNARPIVSESSTDFANGTGHIAGTLVRDRQNRFGPRDASLTGDQLATLSEVAYGQTSRWPEEGHEDLEAAFAYLSRKLGHPATKYEPSAALSPTASPNGIRDQYPAWDTTAVVPDAKAAMNEAWCTKGRPASVDAAACETVWKELFNELLEVKYVNNLLEQLHKAFMEDDNSSEEIITDVTSKLGTDLKPPPAKESLAMTILHFVFSVASVIPEAGEIFEVAGAELDLAESLATDGGSSADPMQAVYDTGNDLLVAADKAFDDAVAHIDAYQPLIVTDYAKLTLVGHRASAGIYPFADGSDLPETPWLIEADKLAGLRTHLKYALTQWLYPPLLDAGFPVWSIAIPSADGYNNAERTPVTYRCTNGNNTTHPFGKEPDEGWIQLGNGHGLYSLALGGTRYDAQDLESYGHHAAVPDKTLLPGVFGTVSDTNVGLDKTWYFEHYFKQQLDTGAPLGIECWPKD